MYPKVPCSFREGIGRVIIYIRFLFQIQPLFAIGSLAETHPDLGPSILRHGPTVLTCRCQRVPTATSPGSPRPLRRSEVLRRPDTSPPSPPSAVSHEPDKFGHGRSRELFKHARAQIGSRRTPEARHGHH